VYWLNQPNIEHHFNSVITKSWDWKYNVCINDIFGEQKAKSNVPILCTYIIYIETVRQNILKIYERNIILLVRIVWWNITLSLFDDTRWIRFTISFLTRKNFDWRVFSSDVRPSRIGTYNNYTCLLLLYFNSVGWEVINFCYFSLVFCLLSPPSWFCPQHGWRLLMCIVYIV